MNTRYLPGALGFLLPGLGHLYIGRPGRSAALFGAFSALALTPFGRWWLPIPIVVSAWEAQRQADRGKAGRAELSSIAAAIPPSTPLRDVRFAAVGLFGLFTWVGLLAPQVLPIGPTMLNAAAADRVGKAVLQCASRQGTVPGALDGCGITLPVDAWGGRFRYRARAAEFEVVSPGRDGRDETGDDLVYRFRFRGGADGSPTIR